MKKNYLLRMALLTAVLPSFVAANAQMDSCNVFMQGHYLELGINASGTFGSSVTEPAGYHANVPSQGAVQFACSYTPTSSLRLGITADPAMSGWTHYYGDFLTPSFTIYGFNSPYESYILSIVDSAMCVNYDLGGLTPNPYCGSNISYDTTGGKRTSTYFNTFDSVTIKQVVSFDADSLFATMDVTFTNISSTAKNDIYYIRTMAPHNDWTLSGNLGTKTKIVYNRPTDPYSLVTAKGMTDTAAYIAMGTTDTNSRCFMYAQWPLPLLFSRYDTTSHAPSNLYHGYYSVTPIHYSGTDTGDNAIGLVFSIPHLAPADSASDSVYRTTAGLHPANNKTIHLFYSFGIGATNSALGIVPTTGVTNINNPEIKVYPNPAGNQLHIDGLLKTDRLRFTDNMGRSVAGNWPVNNDGTNTIATGNLMTGYYILIVTDEAGNIKARIPVLKK